MLQIQQFAVRRLFDVFDHTVPLNPKGVTIIHGPNGFGKTMTLRILQGIFEGDYWTLSALPFGEAEIAFLDGSLLTVERKGGGSLPPKLAAQHRRPRKSGSTLTFRGRSAAGTQLEEFIARPHRPEQAPYVERHLFLLQEYLPHLRRVGQSTWFDAENERQLTPAEVLSYYRDDLPPESVHALESLAEEPQWLADIQSEVSTRLIAADRLQRIEPGMPERGYREREVIRPTVTYYAERLAEHIKYQLAELSRKSADLDRTFPQRVFDYWIRKESGYLTTRLLTTRLDESNALRQEMVRAGIAPPGDLIPWDSVPKGSNARRMLSVYLDDVDSKTALVMNTARRVNLFFDLVNDRLMFKKLRRDPDKGFDVETAAGPVITPDKLSSGEQHEIVLAYELLFEIEDNAFVLIDEPELSLHVDWQLRFLDDLRRIQALKPFRALVATHSPQIVNDAWDLTVALTGPNRGNG